MAGEPVEQFDGDGYLLLGPKESAAAEFVHLVHPLQVIPADVAANNVATHFYSRCYNADNLHYVK